MASSPVLWLITDEASRPAARRRLDQALAYFPADPPPVRELTKDDLLADAVELGPGIAWLWLTDPTAGELFELVGRAEDQHLPALLTRVGDDHPLGTPHHDGVLLCPTDAPAGCVAAVLQSMWSQSRVIESLKLEARALRTQTRGVGNQLGKMDEELRLAAQLQKEFLPRRLPELGGVSFHVMWRPAGYVGGDIYDVERLDEHHLGFFIADAVGHGVPAALMTMFIKRSLETKAFDAGCDTGYRLVTPGEALAKLNRDMAAQQTGQVRFATACYGVIDCRTREITFARAGHPYPLLLKADGTTRRLDPEGGLLGVFPEEEFEQVTVRVDPGDRLLIFSDGFETAFPEPADAADASSRGRVVSERYLDEFTTLAEGDVEQQLARLERRVHDEAGSLNQKDDLTLMCLAVTADAAASPTPLTAADRDAA